jgi:hypothetical protein
MTRPSGIFVSWWSYLVVGCYPVWLTVVIIFKVFDEKSTSTLNTIKTIRYSNSQEKVWPQGNKNTRITEQLIFSYVYHFFYNILYQEVLLRVSEQRNILHEIRKRKANWFGHILRRNCLLKEVIEGKIKGRIEVTRRRGRRRKKLLDDLGGRRGYSHLNEEALDRIKWRNHFGTGCGPVVWQITDDDEWTDAFAYAWNAKWLTTIYPILAKILVCSSDWYRTKHSGVSGVSWHVASTKIRLLFPVCHAP